MNISSGRKPNNVAPMWRGRTINVDVQSQGIHQGKLQAIGWYTEQVRVPIDLTSPFAGLVRFLDADGTRELALMQPTHVERIKVVIWPNDDGLLPEAGEKWAVEITGATTTGVGLLLFGKAASIVAETEGGNPMLISLTNLCLEKKWCRIRVRDTSTRHDDFEFAFRNWRAYDDAMSALCDHEFQGKLTTATLDRDERSRPIITMELKDVRHRKQFYDEDVRHYDWGRWVPDSSQRFTVRNLRDNGNGSFTAENFVHQRSYQIRFSNDEWFDEY